MPHPAHSKVGCQQLLRNIIGSPVRLQHLGPTHLGQHPCAGPNAACLEAKQQPQQGHCGLVVEAHPTPRWLHPSATRGDCFLDSSSCGDFSQTRAWAGCGNPSMRMMQMTPAECPLSPLVVGAEARPLVSLFTWPT